MRQLDEAENKQIMQKEISAEADFSLLIDSIFDLATADQNSPEMNNAIDFLRCKAEAIYLSDQNEIIFDMENGTQITLTATLDKNP